MPRVKRSSLSRLAILIALGMSVSMAQAGVPRFVAGTGWGVWAGAYVGWKGATLQYFTDPGPLSDAVDHGTADAMVAAAAAVWNSQLASIALAQGGQLAEDVDSTNMYGAADGSVVLPMDVQTSTEQAVPLAIVYDKDGSILDSLMGQDASDPASCQSNAVVGDVDDIGMSDGSIRHAVLILNGRCVGSVPEQLEQMQYQLMRAFGRVLGLSWSQNNDNVFSGQQAPTSKQMEYWPVLHPLDVICSPYTYQCMTNPFQLREDDLNTLTQVYPVGMNQAGNGKEPSSTDALYFLGVTYFLTGQSMGWLNIGVRRQNAGITEDWQTVSIASGYYVRQQDATPVAPGTTSQFGYPDHAYDGWFVFRRIPLNGISNLFLTDEPINPLYMGEAAVGPYLRPPVTPSGSPVTAIEWSAYSAGDNVALNFLHKVDGASVCDPGADGVESAPQPLDPSGWQAGQLCGPGHNSWWSLTAAAGHTWTMEVTSTDENGQPSVNKAQPVMGFWQTADPTGTAPTVTSQPVAFNSLAFGMTQTQMPAAGSAQTYRISVSDQFGQGRPDFTYTARALYAAAASPSTLGIGGGQLTVTGTGFRPGMQLFVGGVSAQVTSITPTQIVASAPTLADAGAQTGTPLDLLVVDPATAGSASIPAAVQYASLPDLLQITSSPQTLKTEVAGAVPVAFRVVASDGLTPVAGAVVQLAVTQGSAGLGACNGQASCSVTTDVNGQAETQVTGLGAGRITISLAESSGATAFAQMVDVDPSRTVAISNPTHYVAASATGRWTVQAQALQDGVPAMGTALQWLSPLNGFSGLAPVAADGQGEALLPVTLPSIVAGSIQTVQACAWGTTCATWTAMGVDASLWAVQVDPTFVASVGQSAALPVVVMDVTDGAGHPLELAPVQVHQRVLAWQAPCADTSRCPAAQVLASTVVSLTSDANGQVSFAPLQLAGVPQAVEVAVSSGNFGFVTMTLQKTPEP